MTARARLDVVDMVRELTERHTHREHYQVRRGSTWYGEDHLTTVPPLLDQLWDAPTQGGVGEEGPRAGFASRPAARLEALDVAARIDLEVGRWVRDLGENDPIDTSACLRLLHSLLPAAAEDTRKAVTRDVRRWWVQARIATGWDSPPWKPDNTCPVCSERGTLRVNLAAQGGFCTACHETWDEANIGLLADHIRSESEAERVPPTPVDPCQCPVPKPDAAGRHGDGTGSLVLCPSCGSTRCVHALERAAAADRVATPTPTPTRRVSAIG